jgi:hypothetical protein
LEEQLAQYQDLTKSLTESKEIADRLQTLRIDLEKKLQTSSKLIAVKDNEIASLKNVITEVQNDLNDILTNDKSEMVPILETELEKRELQLRGCLETIKNLNQDIAIITSSSKEDKKTCKVLNERIIEINRAMEEKEIAHHEQLETGQKRLTTELQKGKEYFDELQRVKVELDSLQESTKRRCDEITRAAETEKQQTERDMKSALAKEQNYQKMDKEMKGLVERLTTALNLERENSKLKNEAILLLEDYCKEVRIT